MVLPTEATDRNPNPDLEPRPNNAVNYDMPSFKKRERLQINFKTNREYPFASVTVEFRQFVESLGLAPEQSAVLTLRRTPSGKNGDYGFECFKLASLLGKDAKELAEEYAVKLNGSLSDNGLIQSWETAGGYVNLHLNTEKYAQLVLTQIMELGNVYGSENIGQGETVIVDLSAPNIAKPMSIGHLRSGIIGYVMVRVHEFLGYNVIADNHLGDWGTNFGHLMHAIDLWGNMNQIQTNPIPELVKLYVQVTKAGDGEEKENLETKDKGREWFLRLEKGDPEARRLWKLIRDWSLQEFQRIYDLLDIQFDEMLGESFFENKLQPTVDMLNDLGLLERSQGALVVDFNKYAATAGLDVSAFAEVSDLLQDPVTDTSDENSSAIAGSKKEKTGKVIVQKSDGGSVYLTRDIATFLHRFVEQKADKVLYVVGDEQRTYFQALFAIAKLMELPIADELEHIYFGLYILPEGKMSTRKGRVVLLDELIDEAFAQATSIIQEKKTNEGPETSNRKPMTEDEDQQLIKQLAVGTLKWTDLSRDRRTTIVLEKDENGKISLAKAISLKGDSAAYVQYTFARTKSILDRVSTLEIEPTDFSQLRHPLERQVINLLAEFPVAVKRVAEDYQPSTLTKIIYELSKAYNAFYTQKEELPILTTHSPKERQARIHLTAAVAQVIKNGLWLLGIEAPNKM